VTDHDDAFESNFMDLDFVTLKNNVNFIFKDEGSTKTTYTIGVANEYALELMDLLNESLDFDIYEFKEALEVGTITFELVVIDGSIEAIEIIAEGSFTDTIDIHQDFDIDLSYAVRTDNEADYIVPTTKEDIS
jgi:hypothetical protein